MRTASRIAAMALVALAFTNLGSSWAAADESSGHRPATTADLVGDWQVVKWTTFVDANQLGSYAAPYQWFAFDSDGALRSLTANRPETNARQIRKALESLPPAARYLVPAAGKVEVARAASQSNELWRALVVTTPVRDAAAGVDLHRGDIVMTLLGADEKPLYTRQLRKLDAAAPPVLFPQ